MTDAALTEDDFTGQLAATRIAIVGLGLMGGSLALALRGRCKELVGIDPDPATLDMALRDGVVERAAADPAELLPEADLVILAAPVKAILKLLGDLPRLHPGHPVVLDLGSTKTDIVRAMQALPARFDPLGGHPMCGKEKSSLSQAEARIYAGSTFALVKLGRSTCTACGLAEAVARCAGSIPLWIGAEEHDRQVAATSHLPYLAANALAAVTPPEVAALVGPGFRSTTRVGGTPPAMMLDVLETNRDNVLEALGRFREQIDRLEAQLKTENFAALEQSLNCGVASYRRLVQ